MGARTTRFPCPHCREKFDVPHAELTRPIVCPNCSRRSHLPLAARVLGMGAMLLVVAVGVLVVKAFGLGQPESPGALVALVVTMLLTGLVAGRVGLAVFRAQAAYLQK